MRIAVCARDMDERYALSRMMELALLGRGVLPEVTIFPMLAELLEAAHARSFDLAAFAGKGDAPALRPLCRLLPVIWISERENSAEAFDIGARYFIETPVTGAALRKALTRCLGAKALEGSAV